MKIAYIIFDGMTMLDLVGVYDPVSRLRSIQFIPDLSWDFCSTKAEVKDSFGFTTKSDKTYPDLSTYDVIIVPGGGGTRKLTIDKNFIDWLSTATNVPLKCSVCTGSLLLGAAGFLEGKNATTHFDEYENLKQYGCRILQQKIVEDGDIITSGAVSCSLHLGLYLVNKWCGPQAAKSIRGWMDFAG
jgi:transcriptional regulator GlxA family with amidase domain